jgi:cytochrome d ubiquinol oxidase subunit I
LKGREVLLARRSILVAASFGVLSSIFLIGTGDSSTREIAHVQPMKFAALEGLYHGQEGAGLVALGIISQSEDDPDNENIKDFAFQIEIPNFLSYMAYGDFGAFVPGVVDLIEGNPEWDILSSKEKMERGSHAVEVLRQMKEAKESGDMAAYEAHKAKFTDPHFKENYFKYFGYGFIEDEWQLSPNVPLCFYSFHIMVGLGFFFLILLIIMFIIAYRNNLSRRRGWLRLALWTIPLAYIASMSGWMVAEMGRQPWVIQDLMPTFAAVSRIDAGMVQVTFWLFAAIFTTLAIAEVSIMVKQIKLGPKEGGN